MTQEIEMLRRIDVKLEALVRLEALRTIERSKSKTESILALGRVGLDRNLIADLVGTTPAIVSTRLSEAKKKASAQSKLREEVEGNAGNG